MNKYKSNIYNIKQNQNRKRKLSKKYTLNQTPEIEIHNSTIIIPSTEIAQTSIVYSLVLIGYSHFKKEEKNESNINSEKKSDSDTPFPHSLDNLDWNCNKCGNKNNIKDTKCKYCDKNKNKNVENTKIEDDEKFKNYNEEEKK